MPASTGITKDKNDQKAAIGEALLIEGRLWSYVLCIPPFLVRLYIVKRTKTYLQGVVTVQHGAAVVETVTDPPPPRKKFLKIFRFSFNTESRKKRHCCDAIQIRIRTPIPFLVPILTRRGSRSRFYCKTYYHLIGKFYGS